MKIRFTAPLQGMWDEMQVNLVDHNIAAERNGETATFTGDEDDIDCFISKHYDGSGLNIVCEPVTPSKTRKPS
jgi:stalled ribosome rescue protein Dom34